MPTAYTLTLEDHSLVVNALKDALCELESRDIAELVSQKVVDKVEKAIRVLSE